MQTGNVKGFGLLLVALVTVFIGHGAPVWAGDKTYTYDEGSSSWSHDGDILPDDFTTTGIDVDATNATDTTTIINIANNETSPTIVGVSEGPTKILKKGDLGTLVFGGTDAGKYNNFTGTLTVTGGAVNLIEEAHFANATVTLDAGTALDISAIDGTSVTM